MSGLSDCKNHSIVARQLPNANGLNQSDFNRQIRVCYDKLAGN
jgi:hypothetical protein